MSNSFTWCDRNGFPLKSGMVVQDIKEFFEVVEFNNELYISGMRDMWKTDEFNFSVDWVSNKLNLIDFKIVME